MQYFPLHVNIKIRQSIAVHYSIQSEAKGSPEDNKSSHAVTLNKSLQQAAFTQTPPPCKRLRPAIPNPKRSSK